MSHERARRAAAAGHASREIVPVRVARPGGGGEVVVDTDEGPIKFDGEKLRKLRSVFQVCGLPLTMLSLYVCASCKATQATLCVPGMCAYSLSTHTLDS